MLKGGEVEAPFAQDVGGFWAFVVRGLRLRIRVGGLVHGLPPMITIRQSGQLVSEYVRPRLEAAYALGAIRRRTTMVLSSVIGAPASKSVMAASTRLGIETTSPREASRTSIARRSLPNSSSSPFAASFKPSV